MTHPIAKQWMDWKPIGGAPESGEQILVGFWGAHDEWFSYVANAFGAETGRYMPFAPPTHWTPIIPPQS